MDKFIIANWKMNPSSEKEAGFLLRGVIKNLKKVKNRKIVICPPFLFLSFVKKMKNNLIELGAQDVSTSEKGSQTGQISATMLKNTGVGYVIVGHSERRAQGENSEIINQKIINTLKQNITPVLCLGEKERDSSGNYLNYIEQEIRTCLLNVSSSQVENILIAYEPVWAISDSKQREATKEEFIEIKIFIKKVISDIYSPKIAHNIKILYGGSVNKLNAKYYTEEGGADGLLVGRDSLDAKKFIQIIDSLI